VFRILIFSSPTFRDSDRHIWKELKNTPALLIGVVHAISNNKDVLHYLAVLCGHCFLIPALATDYSKGYTTLSAHSPSIDVLRPHILLDIYRSFPASRSAKLSPELSPVLAWPWRRR